MIRAALVEDHKELRTAIRLLLGMSKDIEVVFEAESGFEAIDLVQLHQPEVLVMDIRIPLLNGLAATKMIVDLSLPTRIILISSLEGPDVLQEAIAAGAHGFVHKADLVKSLLTAIETVYQGGRFFPF